MEQIIILIVIGLISTLFNKKGKTDPEKSKSLEQERHGRPTSQPAVPPHQRNETTGQTDPFKRLKELTGEIYREIQDEQRKPIGESLPARPEVVLQAPQPERTARPAAEKIAEKASRSSTRESSSRSGRLSAHQQEPQTTAVHTSSYLDITDEQDILKGIIFSEILGPPKSKR